ncbi:MAG TPA: hypothetical protein VMT28_10325 [Terriglobales bacterium]|nr:hypothetical protein [Terriglobales bacterium]
MQQVAEQPSQAAGAAPQISLVRRFKRTLGGLVAYCFSWYRY